ncbi:MAG TPA: UbiA family prenyltransferase [Nocardioidaceae bacterium]|jgi:4-hydroxybenzoate polyprenyltransferase
MTRPRPTLRDLAELVRAPAGLTVPGDTLSGAAAAGWPLGPRSAFLPVASLALYWAGMSLNDYADRRLDAAERPERPIPSGRVAPRQALALASVLTVAGVAVAGAAGGRRALRVALPLAGVVWSYDLVLKDTPAGPVAMAAARCLDVLLGASGATRAAALPATAMAVHTLGVTALSRGEVHGTSPAVATVAATGTVLAATVAATPPRPVRRSPARPFTWLLAGTFAGQVARAQAAAAFRPDAQTVRRATGVGIRGMLPLQAALTARTGAVRTAAALLGMGPLVRAASKVVSPT